MSGLLPKIEIPCQFQQFPSRGKFSHFQNFSVVSMRKEQQQSSWLIRFSKILSEHVLRIKTKSHKVWASYGKRYLNGSCESGHLDLTGLTLFSKSKLYLFKKSTMSYYECHILSNSFIHAPIEL